MNQRGKKNELKEMRTTSETSRITLNATTFESWESQKKTKGKIYASECRVPKNS